MHAGFSQRLLGEISRAQYFVILNLDKMVNAQNSALVSNDGIQTQSSFSSQAKPPSKCPPG